MSELDGASGTYDSRASADEASKEKGGDTAFVRMWLDAIETASVEEKDWRSEAEDAARAYRGERVSGQREFNIFHANVETIVPALYNSTPIPDVRRRYSDADPAGKEVADVLERALSYAVDSYDFDASMNAAIKDMQIAGRGVVRVRYLPYLDEDGEEVTYQEVTCEHVPWQHFRHGPANDWASVPWIAFEHFLTKDDLMVLAPEIVDKVPLNYAGTSASPDDRQDGRNDIFRRARVWEIWDKRTRRVIFVSPDLAESALKVEDDPLDLDDFFPVPRPLQAIAPHDGLVPIAPLSIYKDLVSELNEITRRITRLVRQLRPRGAYPGTADDLKKIAEADDGELVPLSSADLMAFASSPGGFDRMIAWWPLQPIVGAIHELFVQREATKQAIYEVTGIADILRGATNPHETLGAQELKAAWGSLRIQRQQVDVARFVAELFNIKAEIFAAKFKPEILAVMTGVALSPPAVELMAEDRLRSYRVDIESDSTVRGDLLRNQRTMAEFLGGTAQYVAAIAPIIQISPGALPAAVTLYGAFARQFKLGKQAEDELEKLTEAAAQPADQPSPAMIEAEKAKAALGLEQQRMSFAAEEAKARLALEAEKIRLEREKLATETRLATAAHNRTVLDEQVKVDEGVIPSLLERLGQIVHQSSETQRALSVALLGQTQKLDGLVERLSAPKRIIRGSDGRAVGVESAAGVGGLPSGPGASGRTN